MSAELPSTQRFEYKYRLNALQYQRVRAAVARSARLDGFSTSGRRRRYFVRSLYFDGHGYPAYVEKVFGVANRIKLRMRSYWRTASEANFVNLELKTRSGVLVDKFAQRVSYADCAEFLARRRFVHATGSVADEFRRLALLRGLTPRLVVDYEREAFVPRDGSAVRVTFDHGLRFAASAELFPRLSRMRTARPQLVVLEIKFRDEQHEWLQDMVRKFELTAAPNSKFGWGIQQTQPSVFQ